MMTAIEDITLREYELWHPDEEQKAQITEWLKKPSSQDRERIDLLDDEEYMKIKLVDGKPEIKADKFVGSVQFDGNRDNSQNGFRISVIPKIYKEDTKDVWKKTVEIIDYANGVSEEDINKSVQALKQENQFSLKNQILGLFSNLVIYILIGLLVSLGLREKKEN